MAVVLPLALLSRQAVVAASVISVLPSAERARKTTGSRCSGTGQISLPLATSHNRTMYEIAAATRLLSGEKETSQNWFQNWPRSAV